MPLPPSNMDELYNHFPSLRQTPKTLETEVLKGLCDHGLYKDEAAQVLEALKKSPNGKAFEAYWNQPVKSDSLLILSAWALAKPEAVKWIDENEPDHWAKAIFDDEQIGQSLKSQPE